MTARLLLIDGLTYAKNRLVELHKNEGIDINNELYEINIALKLLKEVKDIDSNIKRCDKCLHFLPESYFEGKSNSCYIC